MSRRQTGLRNPVCCCNTESEIHENVGCATGLAVQGSGHGAFLDKILGAQQHRTVMKSQLKQLLARLSKLPGRWATLLALLMALLVGVFDFATGFDLHVTAFYLLPVCWASWAAGRKGGFIVATACTIIFGVAGVISRHSNIALMVPLWNSVMVAAIFAIAVYSITAAGRAYRSLAEAQALLREANEHLEETVQLRTAALRAEVAERQRLEREKVQAERLLERQEKLATLGTLTAGIAHEIRNPLTSLKARLYTLDKHLHSVPAAKRDTAIISAEISRLERIVQDALSFARPAEPQLEIIAAESLLKQVGQLMAPDLETRAVKLGVEANPELRILADSGHLKQVLVNLVRNAADAVAGAGVVSLRAGATRARLGGSETEAVTLEVIDTGKGILPEVEKRLFDPFFSTKESGTGLGLAIAARIVEKHGGLLQYETQVGKGTTFRVVLKRVN
jgi:signal transduction histidine kinase